MKMVFEEDIEKSDFLEFILTPREVSKLVLDGLDRDFPLGLKCKRNLNVFIRVDKTTEDYAISEGEGCEIEGRIFGKCSQRDGGWKAAKASSGHSVQ